MNTTRQTSPQLRKGPAQVTGYLTPGSAIGIIRIYAAETLVGCCLS